ncbi:hypothetical protein C2E23DRAFT_734569 [Lenzites betulinus]|nr:hypothetical protein C2E23DRAFT_734569 [Lenzites betulinus]
MAPVPLHQVYSRALFGEGHGYPVWDGELEENEDGTREFEIEVGTVVRYDDGKFWILFHSMRDADDPEQKHGTPPTFVRFTPPPSATSNWRSIKHSLVTSAHVSDHSVDLRASASPVGLEQLCSLDAGITFSHKAKSGGVLCFQTPVQARKLPSKLFIVRHMSEHFDSWVEFANERVGIGLRTQEIFFVHGTQKTCRWACGAFEAHARNVEGSLGASFTPAGSVELKVKFGSHDAARQHFNFGPSKDPRAPVSETAAPMDPATAPFNQCIFLNYYKAKRRLQLWRPRFMEAGAGPHELPDDGDSDDSTQYAVLSGGRSGDSASSNSSDFGEVPERGMVSVWITQHVGRTRR